MRPNTASIALLMTAAAVASCSMDDAARPSADAGPGLDATAGDDASDASDASEAGPTQAMVRFAQLSPDAPALDVCLAAHGTGNYQGPMFAQFAEDAGLPADASAPGLSFAEVSAYFAIDPGAYDVRLVAAGAASCAVSAPVVPDASANDAAGADAGASVGADASADASVGADADASAGANAGAGAGASADASADAGAGAGALPPDTTDLPAFVAGGITTIVLAGDLAPVGADASFRVVAVQDDGSLAGGGASLRAINALPAVADADFGYGSSAGSWSPLFTNVPFGAVSMTPGPSEGKVDANGYLVIAPFSGVFSVRSSGDAGADVASSQSAAVALGDVATVLAVGGKTGDGAHPPALVLCTDNAPSGGLLAVCSVLP